MALLDSRTWDQIRLMVRLGIEHKFDELETLGRMQAGKAVRGVPTGRETRRRGVHAEARAARQKLAAVVKPVEEQAGDVQAELAALAAMGFAVEMD